MIQGVAVLLGSSGHAGAGGRSGTARRRTRSCGAERARGAGGRIAFLAAVLTLLLGSPAPAGAGPAADLKEAMVSTEANGDSIFFRQPLGSGDPCACTPEMEADERGIRIAAPARVAATGELVLPVCAIARFEYAERDTMPANLWQEMVAVAIDVEANRCYTAGLGEPSPPPGGDPVMPEPGEAPAGSGDDDDVPDISGSGSITQYRTFDLVPILELPAAPATYHIFLLYRTHASNGLRVEVYPPEGEGR